MRTGQAVFEHEADDGSLVVWVRVLSEVPHPLVYVAERDGGVWRFRDHQTGHIVVGATLRELRRLACNGGNGRRHGGHTEITHHVTAPRARVELLIY